MSQTHETAPGPSRLLLVDDDPIVRDSLAALLRAEGYEVAVAVSDAQGVDCLKAGRFNLAVIDLNASPADGMGLLRHMRTHHRDIAAIMVSGYGTIASAVEAIKLGACDYLTKPIIDDDVRLCVRRALQQQQMLAADGATLSDGRSIFGGVIAQDYRMAKVFDVIDAVADTRTTILITGESGTGKSLIARAIHAHSSRRDKPFVEVSCGALPETLLEGELFGHTRGAFTGAMSDRPGKFAAAHGGTIFLDEISTASPALQVKLLRVLQERQLEPVGSNQTLEVDVRVVLATNRDLAAEVQAGRFRNDLYYRINVVNIALPPLRQRLSDIALLAEHFRRKFDPAGRIAQGFSADALAAMQRYGWPGNVRELEHCIERAVVLCRKSRLDADDLPADVTRGGEPAVPVAAVAHNAASLQDALAEPERQIIVQTLAANDGSRQKTASQLGINRCTLYKKMKKFHLLGRKTELPMAN